MRTGQDTEFIVTEFVTPTTQNAYILVAIQSCKFTIDEESGEIKVVEPLKQRDGRTGRSLTDIEPVITLQVIIMLISSQNKELEKPLKKARRKISH